MESRWKQCWHRESSLMQHPSFSLLRTVQRLTRLLARRVKWAALQLTVQQTVDTQQEAQVRQLAQ